MATKQIINQAKDGGRRAGITDEEPAATGDRDGNTSEVQSPVKLALLLVALCLAVLCQALDNTIITTAIPKITDEFDSLDDVGWYG